MSENIKPGFITETNEQYHSGPGISKSGLARILRSPLHYQTPTKETPAMERGTGFHTAVLEPDRFKDEYVILPENCRPGSGTGMKGRKERFLAEAEVKNQTIIKQEDMDKVKGMASMVHQHQRAIDLLSDGVAELSGYFYDPDDHNVLIKIRPDWINKSTRIIVELKSTTDSRLGAFVKKAYDLDYHMSAWLTLYVTTQITGIQHDQYYFIVVESSEPYGVNVFKASDQMLQEGSIDCQRALEIYSQCLKVNVWPQYRDDLEEVGLPRWVETKYL